VPPLSHLTSYTPTTSILCLANSLAAAVSEPALYRLLTFHVTNIVPVFVAQIQLTLKEHILKEHRISWGFWDCAFYVKFQYHKPTKLELSNVGYWAAASSMLLCLRTRSSIIKTPVIFLINSVWCISRFFIIILTYIPALFCLVVNMLWIFVWLLYYTELNHTIVTIIIIE
jgi:hypothetical protein